jgi:hypothetical protein
MKSLKYLLSGRFDKKNQGFEKLKVEFFPFLVYIGLSGGNMQNTYTEKEGTMKRRFFFKSALSLGIISGISLLYPNQKGNEGNLYSKIEKVKTAMLSMQHYAWEQGVASQ